MAKTTLQRVEEGKAWLTAHDSDPPARNYIWWQAGIIPGQKHGAHVTAETIADYEQWHKAFTMWLRLYAQLEAENA
jgi:hypothetical protein